MTDKSPYRELTNAFAGIARTLFSDSTPGGASQQFKMDVTTDACSRDPPSRRGQGLRRPLIPLCHLPRDFGEGFQA
jgi:hypothetical protein